jgi:hypothetical protein
VHNQISTKGKGLLVQRSCKSTINTEQSPVLVAKLWNKLNVNASQEWIGRRLGEE